MMEHSSTINRKQLNKALLMYRNYISVYYKDWNKSEKEQANKTLLLLWIFFKETVLFDNKEGIGFEEYAENINEFCEIIIKELTDFSNKIKS